jgi:sec-independent protein translocase protein TatA
MTPGPLELGIVLLIALLVFGPKRLPGLGKQLGTGMREFKDGITGSGSKDDKDDKDDADDQDEPAAIAAAPAAPPVPAAPAPAVPAVPAAPEVPRAEDPAPSDG